MTAMFTSVFQIDIAGAHNNIGIMYQSQKQVDKAEEHYVKAIDILNVVIVNAS